MSATPSYVLAEVPAPPKSTQWSAVLHWMVCVMDADDPDLAFITSVFAHCLKHGGISEKQAKYADRISARLHSQFFRGELMRQTLRQPSKPDFDIRQLTPEGEA